MISDKKKYMKKWRKDNAEHIKKYTKQWNIDNPDYSRNFREDNPDYHKEYYKNNGKEYHRQYYQDNSSIKKKYAKEYRIDHLEYYREYMKQYKKDNREKLNEQKRQYLKNRRKTDLKYHLNCIMRNAIWKSLKGKKANRHWESLVGYTCKDLIKRLKRTMPEGYDWKDFLEGKLHIDHKIPKSIFNFTKPEHIDFQRCWALKNLQLLPARENMVKHDKFSRPFQPAFQI